MGSHPWFKMCNVGGNNEVVPSSSPPSSFSFPQLPQTAESKQTPKTIEVAACPGGKATTPPGQPKTTRNESGDTIIKVTKVSPADDDDGTVEKASKGWFCKLLFCSQERA